MVRFFSISLRKCFVITIGFAVLAIYCISVSKREIWTFRDLPPNAQSQVDNVVVVLKSISTTSVAPKSVPNDAPGVVSTDQIDDQSMNGHTETKQPAAGQNETQTMIVASRPWYFAGGRRLPHEARRNRRSGRRLAKLMPHEDRLSDRITNQLMFVPANYEAYRATGKLKTILISGRRDWNNVPEGRDIFISSKCPVDTCQVTVNRQRASVADLVIHKDYVFSTGYERRPAHQLHMLFVIECPYNTICDDYPNTINWTATYRTDSDIVAPYEKWAYYDAHVKEIDQQRNYASNKTKKVAWFVSNCRTPNHRLEYAKELANYIQVDIYGSCGTKSCPRSSSDSKCFDLLDQDYKFYLSFENSNCKEYITEKFFVNALGHNILPIVMGARPEDYAAAAPLYSYVHVNEFASPRELAAYLDLLDQNDEMYNAYFRWKGTGEFINTFFWCRVCAMLHDDVAQKKSHKDLKEWWNGKGVCQ